MLITLVPLQPLNPLTLHTVTVAGVTDLADNLIAPVVSTFTTGTGTDLITPTVVTVTPPSGAVDVGTNAVVVLEVSERLSPLTVEADDIVLRENATGIRVPGVVTLSADLRQVSFTPDAPLAPGRLYRTFPGFGAEDLAGNRLSGSQTTFTTGSGP